MKIERGASNLGEVRSHRLRPERRDQANAGLRKRLAILGVPIDNLTLDQTLSILERYIEEGGFNQIATANADFLIKAVHDEVLMDILHNCAMVLPDGMPIVWASRFLRHPLRERVTGADLVPRLIELAARRSWGIYLLGAEEHSSAAAAAWIEKTHPGARVAGRCSPPFALLEDMDHEQILRGIEQAKPEILLVAFGNPKQEKWLAMHNHRLQVPVCIGVGASLDFLSGIQQRAPSSMQGSGLEWLHRLVHEPKRLAPRYLSNASGLLRYLSLQLLALCTQRHAGKPLGLSQQWVDQTSIVTVPGDFAGGIVTEFESLLYRTYTPDSRLVIDLSATQNIGPDALGALVTLRKRMRNQHRELWLVGVRPGIRRVLRASILDDRFRFAHDVAHATERARYVPLAGESLRPHARQALKSEQGVI